MEFPRILNSKQCLSAKGAQTEVVKGEDQLMTIKNKNKNKNLPFVGKYCLAITLPQ